MKPSERAETIVTQLDNYLRAMHQAQGPQRVLQMKTARGFLVLALTMALEEASKALVP